VKWQLPLVVVCSLTTAPLSRATQDPLKDVHLSLGNIFYRMDQTFMVVGDGGPKVDKTLGLRIVAKLKQDTQQCQAQVEKLRGTNRLSVEFESALAAILSYAGAAEEGFAKATFVLDKGRHEDQENLLRQITNLKIKSNIATNTLEARMFLLSAVSKEKKLSLQLLWSVVPPPVAAGLPGPALAGVTPDVFTPSQARVGLAEDDSPLKPGDEIVHLFVGDKSISVANWRDVSARLRAAKGRLARLKVRRGNTIITVEVPIE